MASIFRYREGDTHPKPVLCDPNYAIEVGDLLFREPSNGLARPASAMVNQGSETLNQQTFHNNFLGVALQKNGAQPGELLPLNSTVNHSPANVIEVATTGIFEYTLAAAATYNGGEFIGPANAANQLQNQVVKTAIAGLAGSIGRASPAAAEIGQNATQIGAPVSVGQVNVVGVEILSTVFYGGEYAIVAGSSGSSSGQLV
jgi:hypothetical protein